VRPGAGTCGGTACAHVASCEMKSGNDNLAHDHEAHRVVAPTTRCTALSNAITPNQANFVSASANMFRRVRETELILAVRARPARTTDTLHHTVELRRQSRKKLQNLPTHRPYQFLVRLPAGRELKNFGYCTGVPIPILTGSSAAFPPSQASPGRANPLKFSMRSMADAGHGATRAIALTRAKSKRSCGSQHPPIDLPERPG
jgi:hypothetical protein